MHGVPDSSPDCIHNSDELTEYINRMGFLPLFRNPIKGFSIEEHTNPDYWWSGNVQLDPWEWRIIAARDHKVAYGKFFGGKAGFISLEWLPVFANARRNGYDFDSLWDDEKVSYKLKKIMDCFEEENPIISYELKEKSGYGKGGYGNFDGAVTELQNMMYLVMSDFRRKLNKKGEEYGWSVAVFSRPEDIWGYEAVTFSYREPPFTSYNRIAAHISGNYEVSQQSDMTSVIGKPSHN